MTPTVNCALYAIQAYVFGFERRGVDQLHTIVFVYGFVVSALS